MKTADNLLTAEDNWLWRQICRERFPFVQVSRYGNSWKRCFASRHKVQNAWEGGRPGDFKMTPLRAHQNYVSAFDYYRNNVVSGSADQTLQASSQFLLVAPCITHFSSHVFCSGLECEQDKASSYAQRTQQCDRSYQIQRNENCVSFSRQDR